MRPSRLFLPLTMVLALGGSALAEDQHARLDPAAPLPSPKPAAQSIELGSLNWHSDYAPFMAKECPPELRSRALRQLWRSMPPGEELRADPF